MPEKSLGLRVHKSNGERIRRALVERGLFDRNRSICSEGSDLLMPVLPLDDSALAAMSEIAEFELISFEFPEEERALTIEDIIGYRPSFEIIGDIAILDGAAGLTATTMTAGITEIEDSSKIEDNADIKESIETRESTMTQERTEIEESMKIEVASEIVKTTVSEEEERRAAEAIMSTNKSVKSVIVPVSDVEGEFRTRRFRHVLGEARCTTIHKEHGLYYKVDLERAYFTPRLGTERLRIAKLLRPGDVVLDMFAGVGPYSLLFSKHGARVIAIDKNPAAVLYLRENAIRNKIKDIEIFEGDAAELALRYSGKADHVIMNLPHSASSFLIPGLKACKSGGILHYYCIASEDDLYRDLELIVRAADEIGVDCTTVYKGIVRSYAPRRHNVVLDVMVK